MCSLRQTLRLTCSSFSVLASVIWTPYLRFAFTKKRRGLLKTCRVPYLQRISFHKRLHAALIQTGCLPKAHSLFTCVRNCFMCLVIRLSLYHLSHLATIQLESISAISLNIINSPATTLIPTTIHTLTHRLICTPNCVRMDCALFQQTTIPVITKTNIQKTFSDMVSSGKLSLSTTFQTFFFLMALIFILVHSHTLSAQLFCRHRYRYCHRSATVYDTVYTRIVCKEEANISTSHISHYKHWYHLLSFSFASLPPFTSSLATSPSSHHNSSPNLHRSSGVPSHLHSVCFCMHNTIFSQHAIQTITKISI